MASGLKQLVMRWTHKTLHHHHRHRGHCHCCHSDSKTTDRYPPSGFIFVFVGPERKRFAIPVRFLNLNIFKCLLREAAEEFGHGVNGCLILPCEIAFFNEIVDRVKKDEHTYGKLSLEEFANMVLDFDEENNNTVPFTPLLEKAKG